MRLVGREMLAKVMWLATFIGRLGSPLEKRRALLLALESGHAAAKAGNVTPLTDELLRSIAVRGRARAERRRKIGTSDPAS
jgi:hypothetical protein